MNIQRKSSESKLKLEIQFWILNCVIRNVKFLSSYLCNTVVHPPCLILIWPELVCIAICKYLDHMDLSSEFSCYVCFEISHWHWALVWRYALNLPHGDGCTATQVSRLSIFDSCGGSQQNNHSDLSVRADGRGRIYACNAQNNSCLIARISQPKSKSTIFPILERNIAWSIH